MSDQFITSEPFVDLTNSNLLTELDTQITEEIRGGQAPLAFYRCAKDRFVIDYNGYNWYRGTRGCDVIGRNEAPEEVKKAAER
jgi:hypothetical protein